MGNIFLRVLNMSLSGAVVIGTILLARLLLKRAPKKWSYLLWLAAGFRLVCPVSIKGFFSLFSLAPKAAESVSGTGAMTAFSPVDYVAGRAVTPAAFTPAASAMPSMTAAPVVSSPAAAAPVASPAAGINWLSVLGVIWLTVAAAMIVWGLVRCFSLKKRLATAVKLSSDVKLPEGLKIPVLRSENVETPFIFGIFRPRIYVPYGLSGGSLECVLEHEQCHLRRGDHIARALSYLILAVHWFNPLCWLAFLLVGKDMELSCDEKVLSMRHEKDIRREYSSTLLSFACKNELPAINPIAFGETSVKSRIKHAARFRKPRFIITAAAALVTVLVLTACMVNPAARTQGDPEPVKEAEATPAPTEAPTETPVTTAEPAIYPDYEEDSDYYLIPHEGKKTCIMRKDVPLLPGIPEALCDMIEAEPNARMGVFEKALCTGYSENYVLASFIKDTGNYNKRVVMSYKQTWLSNDELRFEPNGWVYWLDSLPVFEKLVNQTANARALSEEQLAAAKQEVVRTGVYRVLPIVLGNDDSAYDEAEGMLEAVCDPELSDRLLAELLQECCWYVSPLDYTHVMLLGLKKDVEHSAVFDMLLGEVFRDEGNYLPFAVSVREDGSIASVWLNNWNEIRLDGSPAQ